VPKGKKSCGFYINGFVAPSPSNLSFPTINNTYKSTDLFIVPAVHKNIQQTGFDNSKITHELIVKHKGNTGATNLYLCFFLVNGSGDAGTYSSTTVKDIDGLISYIASPSDGSSSIALNNYITVDKNSKAVLYVNQNTEPVIVFTSPVVTLKSDLSKLINQTNFDKDLKIVDYNFLLSNSTDSLTNVDLSTLKNPNWPSNGKLSKGMGFYLVSNNIIYTMNGDQIYMECQPTGVSADEIKAYNVPIDSEYTNNSKKYDSMRDLVSVSIFFTLLLFYYFAGPYLYKLGVIDNVNKFVFAATDDEKASITRMTTVDTFIFLYMIILIIVVAVKYQLSVMYLVVFFVLGIAIINYNKLFDDFMTTKVKNDRGGVKEYKMNLPKSATFSYFDPRDIIAFIRESMDYLPNKDLYSGILLFFVIIIICVLAGVKATPKNDLKITQEELSLTYIGLIGIVPIFSMIRMHYVDVDTTVSISKAAANVNAAAAATVAAVAAVI